MKNKQWYLLKIFLVLAAGQMKIFNLQGYAEVISQENAASWEGWYKSIITYLDESKDILQQSQEILNKYGKHVDEIKASSFSVSEAINKIKVITPETRADVLQVKNKFITLHPPADFENYHRIIVQALDSHLLFIDVASKCENVNDAADQYVSFLIKATEEIERVFIKHKAPQSYIDAQDALIRRLSEESHTDIE